MSSNDIPKVPADDEAKITQPMIGEVFKLLEELKQSMESRFDAINARLDETNARLDVTNTRLDEIESRLARDIEGVNARLTELAEGQKELSYKMNALNRSRLQTEADYENLFDRIRELESKAS